MSSFHQKKGSELEVTYPSIRQMSGLVSRGSAGEYQADERAGVARLSWRVSGICIREFQIEHTADIVPYLAGPALLFIIIFHQRGSHIHAESVASV